MLMRTRFRLMIWWISYKKKFFQIRILPITCLAKWFRKLTVSRTSLTRTKLIACALSKTLRTFWASIVKSWTMYMFCICPSRISQPNWPCINLHSLWRTIFWRIPNTQIWLHQRNVPTLQNWIFLATRPWPIHQEARRNFRRFSASTRKLWNNY